jgi:uncharacterized repeat protein (TIGR02543 family)
MKLKKFLAMMIATIMMATAIPATLFAAADPADPVWTNNDSKNIAIDQVHLLEYMAQIYGVEVVVSPADAHFQVSLHINGVPGWKNVPTTEVTPLPDEWSNFGADLFTGGTLKAVWNAPLYNQDYLDGEWAQFVIINSGEVQHGFTDDITLEAVWFLGADGARLTVDPVFSGVFPAGGIINSNIRDGKDIPPGGSAYDIGKYRVDARSDLEGRFTEVAGIRFYIGHPDGPNGINDAFSGAIQYKNKPEVGGMSQNFAFGGWANAGTDENPRVIVSDKHTIEWFANDPLFKDTDPIAEFYLTNWCPTSFYVMSWEYLDKWGRVVSTEEGDDRFYVGVANSNMTYIPEGGGGSHWDIGKFVIDAKVDLPDSFTDITGIRIGIGHPRSNWAISESFNGAIQWKNSSKPGGMSDNIIFGGWKNDHPDKVITSDRFFIEWDTNTTPLFQEGDELAEIWISAWWPNSSFAVTSWEYLDASGDVIADVHGETMFHPGQRLDIHPFGGTFSLIAAAGGPGEEPDTWDWRALYTNGDLKGGHNGFNNNIDLSYDLFNRKWDAWTGRETDINLGISPFAGFWANVGDYVDIGYKVYIDNQPLYVDRDSQSRPIVGGPVIAEGVHRAVFGDRRDTAYIELMHHINNNVTVATGSSLLNLGAPDDVTHPARAIWVSDGIDGINSGISADSFTTASGMEIQTSGLTFDPEANIQVVWQGTGNGWAWNDTIFKLDDILFGDVIKINFSDLKNYNDFVNSADGVKIILFDWIDGGGGDISKLGIVSASLNTYAKNPLGDIHIWINTINGVDVFPKHNTDINLGKPDIIDSGVSAIWISNGVDGIINGVSPAAFTKARGIEITLGAGDYNPATTLQIVGLVSGDGWNWQQTEILLGEVLVGNTITIDFKEHLPNYSAFVRSDEIKFFVRYFDDGIADLNIVSAKLYGCACEFNDGYKVNLGEANFDAHWPVTNPPVINYNQVWWGVDGMKGNDEIAIFNGITMNDFRNSRGIAIELENLDLLLENIDKNGQSYFSLIWQNSYNWDWNQTNVYIPSVICADDIIRIDFEEFIFRYDYFVGRNEVKLWLAYWDWDGELKKIDLKDLNIVDAYLYGYHEDTPYYEYQFDMGANTDFGGASANQWLWASNGTDDIEDSNRLESWQFKAATGVAFYFGNDRPDEDAELHLIWQGDAGNWNWNQFTIPVREVYNRTENAVFIDLQRYINNYTAFSNSDYLKLGIAYWETDLYTLGIEDAFLYGTNCLYREFNKNLLIGKRGWNGAQLFEGNYRPYDIDFSKVAEVKFVFNIANIADLDDNDTLAVVLNIGKDFNPDFGWVGGINSLWQQEAVTVEKLKAADLTYTMTPGMSMPANNAGLDWFQAAVASFDDKVSGSYDLIFLDAAGKEIPLVRNAQVVFTGVENNPLGFEEWISFNGNRPQSGCRTQNMNFSGTAVTGAGSYTVKIDNFNGEEGNWRFLAVNVGDNINLNEFYLTALSVKIDGGASVNVPLDKAVLAPDYREISLYNYWWNDNGNIEWHDIPYPENSIEISFTIARYNVEAPGFPGFDINYNLNGGTNPENAPKTYASAAAPGAIALPIPTRAGFTFGGWYTVETFASNSLISTTAESFGPLTIYARWFDNAAAGARYNVGTTATEAGRVFTVNISITGNTGVAMLRNSLVYDTDVFELIGVELNTSNYNGLLTRNVANILWEAQGLANNTNNNTFATLSFRVRSSAPTGGHIIAVNHGSAIDSSLNRPPFTGGAGVINVTNNNTPHKLGDINGDGEVGMIDLLLLRLHIVEAIKLDGHSFVAADLNKDGVVGLSDLLLLRQYIAGDINLGS